MAKMENLLKAPPEKRSNSPKRLPLAKSFSIAVGSTPGTGIWVPRRKTANIISVALDAPQDVISALSGKLGRLPGVTAKTLYAPENM